jgi:anaerobic nitric oxide reductase transcription regulator
VRELDNVISRGVLRAAQGRTERDRAILVDLEHLDLRPALPLSATDRHGLGGEEPQDVRLSLAERVDAFRRRIILETVALHGGNWAAAARALGLHRSNLHQLAARLGLRVRKSL